MSSGSARIDAHKSPQASCRPRCCPTRSNKIGVGLGGSPTQNDTTSLTARSPRQIATSPRAKLPQENATRTETATLAQGVQQSLTKPHNFSVRFATHLPQRSAPSLAHFRSRLHIAARWRPSEPYCCKKVQQLATTPRRHSLTIPLSLCRIWLASMLTARWRRVDDSSLSVAPLLAGWPVA